MRIDPMRSRMRKIFDRQRVERIESDIRDVEDRTSCELIVAIAPRAARYDRAADLMGLAGSLMALSLGSFIGKLLTDPPVVSGSWATAGGMALGLLPAFVLVLAGFPLGVGAARLAPRASLLFVPRRVREQASRAAAEAAFHRLRMRRTDGATGVLIFISMLEHLVEVIPDEAAEAVLDPEAIRRAATTIAEGFSRGDGPGAMTAAFVPLGQELEAKLPRRPDDTDELPNKLHLL